jgi:hypothetical protein
MSTSDHQSLTLGERIQAMVGRVNASLVEDRGIQVLGQAHPLTLSGDVNDETLWRLLNGLQPQEGELPVQIRIEATVTINPRRSFDLTGLIP